MDSPDIDYINILACPTCKDRPPIVIFDGIAMGTTKSLPKTLHNFDEQQKLPIIPVAERILIVKDEIRKMNVQYAVTGMANPNFDEMLYPGFFKHTNIYDPH